MSQDKTLQARRQFLQHSLAATAACALAPGLARAAASAPLAPSLSVMHAFTGADGAAPQAGVVQRGDGSFCGTAALGGAAGFGSTFRILADGSFNSLHDFQNNATDGSSPASELLVSGTWLYGTMLTGGAFGIGGVYRVSVSGNFQLLHSFADTDGSFPSAGLVAGGDGFFYGVASAGGVSGDGTLFRIAATGPATLLRSFSAASDGSSPNTRLVRGNDGALYGSTLTGGPKGGGTVFRYEPSSGAFSVITAFTGVGKSPVQTVGALLPRADGSLVGCSYFGGSKRKGCVYSIAPGGALTVLHSFTGGADGLNPGGGLLLASDGLLYGITHGGGVKNRGTLFSIDTANGYTSRLAFTQVRGPRGTLIQARDGTLVGTAESGGASLQGAVFRITL